MKRPYKLLICNSVSKKNTVPHSARFLCKKLFNIALIVKDLYICYCWMPQRLLNKICKNVQIERDICQLISKLITAIFINQQVRVKCGNHFSKPFVTSNGVNQGGVLSPVLFTLYKDKLLNRLRQSKLGCYVGDIFMGAFA